MSLEIIYLVVLLNHKLIFRGEIVYSRVFADLSKIYAYTTFPHVQKAMGNKTIFCFAGELRPDPCS